MNRMPTLFLALWLGPGALAGAQIWMDPFDYMPGPLWITPWKAHRGQWKITTQKLAEADPVFAWQYATRPKRSYRDCVVQCLVMYNPGSKHTLQFGGATLRCKDPSNGVLGQDLVMVKVQSGDPRVNPKAFDSIWLYEINASGTRRFTARRGLRPFPRATVRLLAMDSLVLAQVDSDGDGLWNHVVSHTLTTMVVKSAPIGIDGFGGVHIDDFKLWDGVVLADPASPPPRPGNEIKLLLRGAPNAVYRAAASLGNSGIALGDDRVIPLSVDPLLVVSLAGLLPEVFKDFAGTMNGMGDATIRIALPDLPALSGLTLYTAFVNLAGPTVLHISNDHQVTIQ